MATATLTVKRATVTSIAVTPANLSLARNQQVTVRAIDYLSDNTVEDLTTSVTWYSSSGSVASVSPTGVVLGVQAGQSVISGTSVTIDYGSDGTHQASSTTATIAVRIVASGPNNIGSCSLIEASNDSVFATLGIFTQNCEFSMENRSPTWSIWPVPAGMDDTRT